MLAIVAPWCPILLLTVGHELDVAALVELKKRHG
jgi:hypothetical protein